MIELLGTKFLVGGRSASGLDCLGVVLLGLDQLGVPEHLRPDPWAHLRRSWEDGDRSRLAEAFPPGWTRVSPVPAVPADGAIVLLPARPGEGDDVPSHVGLCVEGYVWSARRTVGVYSAPWFRVMRRILEYWELRS